MDQEVAKTLGELELKLQELERELSSIGPHDPPGKPKQAPGRLIDEAVERESDRGDEIDVEPRDEAASTGSVVIDEDASVEGDGFGGPPVFGGEEVPAQAGATIERDWTAEVRETAYGEIPTPPSPSPSPPMQPGMHPPSARAETPPPTPRPDPRHPAAVEESQALDLAELVRFRDKLRSTMDALIDEYSQLLSTESPSHPRRDA